MNLLAITYAITKTICFCSQNTSKIPPKRLEVHFQSEFSELQRDYY